MVPRVNACWVPGALSLKCSLPPESWGNPVPRGLVMGPRLHRLVSGTGSIGTGPLGSPASGASCLPGVGAAPPPRGGPRSLRILTTPQPGVGATGRVYVKGGAHGLVHRDAMALLVGQHTQWTDVLSQAPCCGHLQRLGLLSEPGHSSLHESCREMS